MTKLSQLPVACRTAIIGAALFGIPAAARAWSSVRETYHGSIKELAAVGSPGAVGRPAVVRSELTPAERGAQMPFEVALRMRNFAELQGRIAKGELVSAKEMDARYFPMQADYDRVVQWAKDQGFELIRTDANRLAVFARGSVDATAAAFQVTFARVGYRDKEYTSAVTAPSVPIELSSMVLGIHGLQPHIRPHGMVHQMPLDSGQVSYLPSQILTAYGAGSIAQTGSGQTIALVEYANPLTSDLTAFWTAAGVTDSLANVQFVSVGAGPDSSTASDYTSALTEASLDAQWASGLAPGAVIRVYGISSSDALGFDEALQQIYADLATNPQIHQLSISFSNSEAELAPDYFLIESQYFAAFVGAGVTVLADSGDGGERPSFATGKYNIAAPTSPTYPASDPSVTGVGGTSLILNPDNTIQAQTGWDGSGGGTSAVFSRPSWQDVSTIYLPTARLVPDVSSVADPDTGAVIFVSGAQAVVGGTSWSAPTWAAFCALINQARQSASPPGPPLGFLNPKLYALQGTPAIVDVQGGHSNDSYPATQGFDLCTGLGSPNIAAMIQLIGNADAPLVLLGQSGWQMVTYGQTATFAVSTYPAASQLTFQWQGVGASVGGVEQPWANLTDNADYAGTKTPVLSVANVEPNQGEDNFFRCVVSDGVSSITSTEAYLEAISTGVTTLAGWPQAGGTADGTGRAARFDFVGSVRLDSQGNIYVADAGNNTVRKVTPGGVVTTVAGTPEKPGSQDGPATQALFDDPAGVAVDASGNLYVADSGNYTIRKIEMPSGLVSTLAGSPGVQGTASGTGGNAQFYDMQNIAADNFGNLYVADGMSDTVRKVVIATGAVTTFAGTAGVVGSSDGTGGESRWNDPTGIATDAAGNVYVSDTGNCTVRKITPSGVVTTIAGIPGVPWSQVGPGLFTAPAGLSVDSSGNIFVGDVGTYRISEISPGGAVTPVAGSAQGAVDGPPSSAEFWFPCDVAVDPDGAIYVADGYNDTVRRVAPSLPAPSFALGLPQYPFVNVGSTVVFSRVVTGATSYQWLFDGAPISDSPTDGSVTTNVVSGATGDHLVISNCTYAAAGSYSLEAFGPGGITQVISSADVLSLGQTAKPGTISSISSRAYVGTGNNILIGGFYVVGNTSATVLVQAIGPALSGSPFNVSGVLQHPTLTIHQYQNGNDVVLYQDTGWGSSQVLLNAAAAVYAQPVLSPGSADSELLVTLPPGGYTAEVVGADGGTGVALCGIYQLP